VPHAELLQPFGRKIIDNGLPAGPACVDIGLNGHRAASIDAIDPGPVTGVRDGGDDFKRNPVSVRQGDGLVVKVVEAVAIGIGQPHQDLDILLSDALGIGNLAQ